MDSQEAAANTFLQDQPRLVSVSTVEGDSAATVAIVSATCMGTE